MHEWLRSSFCDLNWDGFDFISEKDSRDCLTFFKLLVWVRDSILIGFQKVITTIDQWSWYLVNHLVSFFKKKIYFFVPLQRRWCIGRFQNLKTMLEIVPSYVYIMYSFFSPPTYSFRRSQYCYPKDWLGQGTSYQKKIHRYGEWNSWLRKPKWVIEIIQPSSTYFHDLYEQHLLHKLIKNLPPC